MEVSFRSLLSFLEIPSALATAGFLKPIPKPLTQFQPPPSVQSLCQGLSQIGNLKKGSTSVITEITKYGDPAGPLLREGPGITSA